MIATNVRCAHAGEHQPPVVFWFCVLSLKCDTNLRCFVVVVVALALYAPKLFGQLRRTSPASRCTLLLCVCSSYIRVPALCIAKLSSTTYSFARLLVYTRQFKTKLFSSKPMQFIVRTVFISCESPASHYLLVAFHKSSRIDTMENIATTKKSRGWELGLRWIFRDDSFKRKLGEKLLSNDRNVLHDNKSAEREQSREYFIIV